MRQCLLLNQKKLKLQEISKENIDLLKAKASYYLLLKVTFQENFGERIQIQSCPSPCPTKCIYPTRFNSILENPDHAYLFLTVGYDFV